MLLPEAITADPTEQELVSRFSQALAPFYRPDLPHHNFLHPHDEVLPEVIQLADIDPACTTLERYILIAASLGHDALEHLPLSPAFRTKEQRAGAITAVIARDIGFTAGEANATEELIESTNPQAACDTPSKVKLRRGDLKNVGGRRLPFLGTAVNVFYEKQMLAQEQGLEAPLWTPYMTTQRVLLRGMNVPDLSVGREQSRDGRGTFNRRADENIDTLWLPRVEDPWQFVTFYGSRLQPYVAGFSEERITGRAAA